MTHRVDPYGGLWLSSTCSAAGTVTRLHSSERFAAAWAAELDTGLNPRRGGTVPPLAPATSQQLRNRIAQLAQICLSRSKATLHTDATKAGAGAVYSERAQAYWLAMFRICMDLLQRVDARPADRPMPGRTGMVPCRHCRKPLEESALLVALLREREIDIGLSCGCAVVEVAPPSEDAELPDAPPQRLRLPPFTHDPREILLGARTTPSERDSGIRAHKIARAAREILVQPPVATRVELDPDPIPEEPVELESERDVELDREPDREQPARSSDDEWIF